MAANTKIEWAHHTFNPWIGCSKVSAGCANCYAEEMMDRRFGKATWGDNGTRVRTSEANWKKPLAWNKAAEAAGVRHRVFCASLADVFEDRPRSGLDRWRVELFELILATPCLDWLLLTKRPEHAHAMMLSALDEIGQNTVWPMPNIWIGTSVENQEQADKRIPALLSVPAKVRFLSMEPLLGPVNLADLAFWVDPKDGSIIACEDRDPEDFPHIHWVIVGGESGHDARPMHPDWVRSLRDQCAAAGVPFFFKQWGEWVVATSWNMVKHNKTFRGGTQGCCWLDIDGRIEPVSSHGLSDNAYAMIRVGKHAAGRTLDDQVHDAAPEVES